MPVAFDAPLAAHHKMIGRWVAAHEESARRYARAAARRHIERAFEAAVLEILKPFKLADLRVVVLIGDGDLAPALAVICDSIGQIDLGWIEKSNVLRNTLQGSVAPTCWQAAAYRALVELLPSVLPIFDFDYLLEEFAAYHWDGETDDLAAVKAMTEWHGQDPEEIDEEMLPSAVKARRPEWMLPERAAPLRDLPSGLADRIRRLRAAHASLKKIDQDGNAWCCLSDLFHDYIPGFEDSSTVPPMTLVPQEEFARELDDVGRIGMETAFMDCAGLCPLTDVGRIDRWFASFRLGAELLLAAQDLIQIDPTKERAR